MIYFMKKMILVCAFFISTASMAATISPSIGGRSHEDLSSPDLQMAFNIEIPPTLTYDQVRACIANLQSGMKKSEGSKIVVKKGSLNPSHSMTMGEREKLDRLLKKFSACVKAK